MITSLLSYCTQMKLRRTGGNICACILMSSTQNVVWLLVHEEMIIETENKAF